MKTRNFLPIRKLVKHKASCVLHSTTQDNLHAHPDRPRISLWFIYYRFLWLYFKLIAMYSIIKHSVPMYKYVLYMLCGKGVGERGEWFRT